MCHEGQALQQQQQANWRGRIVSQPSVRVGDAETPFYAVDTEATDSVDTRHAGAADVTVRIAVVQLLQAAVGLKPGNIAH